MARRTSMAASGDHVTYEINQIGRNFECLGRDAAVAATADHIRLFWAPQLRESLASQARNYPEAFSPIANDAIALLSLRPSPEITGVTPIADGSIHPHNSD